MQTNNGPINVINLLVLTSNFSERLWEAIPDIAAKRKPREDDSHGPKLEHDWATLTSIKDAPITAFRSSRTAQATNIKPK